MRGRTWVVSSLIVTGFVGLVAYRVYTQRNAFADAPPPPVQSVAVVAARYGSLAETLELNGTVIFPAEAKLSPKVVGALHALHVVEGQQVSKGQLIATIDHAELDAQLAQARASVSAARAGLDLAVSGARAEEIQQARAGLRQAEANQTWARNDYVRFKELLAMQAITRQQYELAANKLQIAEEQVRSARAALRQLQLGARPQQVSVNRAQVQGANASVQLIQAQIANHYVRAPFTGRITQKFVEPGALVSPSLPLVSLAANARPQVEVAVPETELGRLRVGQPARVKGALAGRELAAKVALVSPIVDPQARLVKVKLDLLPAPGLSALRGGMTVETAIEVASHPRAILVPTGALNVDSAGRATVFVVTPESKARAKPVGIIARQPLQAAVSGLDEGERVVAAGNAFIQDGEPVSVRAPLPAGR